MRFDVKRQLFARSERVKGIDFHPTEPWVLTTLYSGHVHIWSYETGTTIKTFEVTDVPVRAGRFVARKNWIVTGSDDFQLRVVNYNTAEKVTAFEAHPDYIRAIAVHPSLSFVLTASDDMTIKLWDWEKAWKCVQIFEGHSHYVMSISINPKDTNTFASACLDRTVKIWSLGSATANFTLEAHEIKGVNWVDYYPHSDKPYILTTSDDKTVKVWDYTSKQLVSTLEGHQSNVSFACYHPELPIIISGSEDGTVKIWNANTARLEQTLNYGLERAWCVSYQRGKQNIAIGFDEGMVVLKMGREEPAMSMDSSGKIIYAKHTDIVTTQIKGIEKDQKDGERLTLPTKDLGSTEVYPQSLQHSPNGRFVAACGDGEWIIYTSLALRNQAFGSGLDFAWGSKENDKDYAVRESATCVKLYRNFKERPGGGLDVGFQAEGLSGGTLLGVKGQGGIGFFDWTSGKLVRRIEVEPRTVYWSESGELVALACDDTFYVLRFSREAYENALGNGEVDEDGVEAAFEVITDQPETATSGCWVGDCFVYTTSTHRLNYLVGEKSYTVSHFDQPMYTLGYLARDGRIYLCDKDVTIVSFALSLALVEFQTLVLRDDLETAMEMLPDIGIEQKGKIARFLEGQGYKEEALEVATDPEHRFDLALSLGKLDQALELARERDEEHKWRVVGDAALTSFDLALAEECFWHAKDLGSLLLLYSASNDATGLRKLADRAREVSSHNILFDCYWLLGDVSSAIDLLRDEAGALTGPLGRKPEAALFALTYAPSKAPQCLAAWKGALDEQGRGRVAKGLGVPPGTEGVEADAELFEQWDAWLEREKSGGEFAEEEVTAAAAGANGASEEDGEAEEGAEEEAGGVEKDGEGQAEKEVEDD